MFAKNAQFHTFPASLSSAYSCFLTSSVTKCPDEGAMSSAAGQDSINNEKQDQNTPTKLIFTVDDYGNMTDTTEYVTGWRLVAVAGALVMSIFLVCLPHFERRVTGKEQC